MSRTRKDLPAHIRAPEEDYWYGREKVEYWAAGNHWRTGEYYERICIWYKDIPGAKTKKKRRGHHWKYWTQITPMWWIHDMMTVPQRAKGRMWEHTVVKMEIDDLIDVDIPNVDRKPHHYYW